MNHSSRLPATLAGSSVLSTRLALSVVECQHLRGGDYPADRCAFSNGRDQLLTIAAASRKPATSSTRITMATRASGVMVRPGGASECDNPEMAPSPGGVSPGGTPPPGSSPVVSAGSGSGVVIW